MAHSTRRGPLAGSYRVCERQRQRPTLKYSPNFALTFACRLTRSPMSVLCSPAGTGRFVLRFRRDRASRGWAVADPVESLDEAYLRTAGMALSAVQDYTAYGGYFDKGERRASHRRAIVLAEVLAHAFGKSRSPVQDVILLIEDEARSTPQPKYNYREEAAQRRDHVTSLMRRLDAGEADP
jgi:hypothetical protein